LLALGRVALQPSSPIEEFALQRDAGARQVTIIAFFRS
jgi:hypothetical protein